MEYDCFDCDYELGSFGIEDLGEEIVCPKCGTKYELIWESGEGAVLMLVRVVDRGC